MNCLVTGAADPGSAFAPAWYYSIMASLDCCVRLVREALEGYNSVVFAVLFGSAVQGRPGSVK